MIGTLITLLVPDSFFTDLNLPSIVTMLIVLLVAIPMYVCSTGSIPIAAALMLKGLSPGAALVLLIAGPGVSVASLLVVGKSLGKKQLLFYLGSIIIGSMICGLFVDNFLPREWFTITSLCESSGHCASHGGVSASWFEIVSGIFLVLLLINAFMLKFFKKEETVNENQVVYRIDGMSCNHCKNSVEKAIKALDNVEDVEVILGKKEAVVTGKPNDEIVKKTVEEIYAKTGMTLTDAFNTFIQQSLNVEGLPFIVTKNSKEALREQAVAMLMLDLKRSEERAEIEDWIDADDLERELGVID